MKAIRKIIAALVALSACMSYTFALADNVDTNHSTSAYQTVSVTADSGECGDNLKWVLDTNGTLTISGTGEMSEYAFQTSQHQFTAEENEQYMQELENHKFPWFEKNSPELITNIIIEDGVESISDMAFYGTSIKSISLPNSVKKIGKSSIANCAKLEKITLSDNITEIPTGAFNSDYKLTSIELPTKLTSIGASAFLNCESLESINIPDTVTEIGDRAFTNSGLKKLIIPKGVTVIHSGLCSYSSNLETVVFSPDTTEIKNDAFLECSKLKSIDLPDGLTKIGETAFSANTSANVYIPTSVITIEKDAFNQKDVIYGYENSAAEEFAKTNDIKFIAINSHDEYLSLSENSKPQETSTPKKLTVKNGKNISMTLDGENVDFSDALPFIDENGRTQIPIYAVIDMLDCGMDWDSVWNGDSTVIITTPTGDVAKITIGKSTMTFNDKEIQMDTVAMINEDRTYIPIRFFAEAMGLDVEWAE